MTRKAVYLNGRRIGSASTWHEVAEIVGEFLGRHFAMREIVRYGSEGPSGFYIRMGD